MAALQQRLLQLVHKFDAMGIATMLQGLVACGAPPSVELQAVLAGHIKKGLARPSQVGFEDFVCSYMIANPRRRLYGWWRVGRRQVLSCKCGGWARQKGARTA
jgi:hypothetical protein